MLHPPRRKNRAVTARVISIPAIAYNHPASLALVVLAAIATTLLLTTSDINLSIGGTAASSLLVGLVCYLCADAVEESAHVPLKTLKVTKLIWKDWTAVLREADLTPSRHTNQLLIMALQGPLWNAANWAKRPGAPTVKQQLDGFLRQHQPAPMYEECKVERAPKK